MLPLPRLVLTSAALSVALLAAGCATEPPPPPAAADAAPPMPPEPPAIESAAPVVTHHAMVVAANPLAAQAGREILQKGGSAIDATIAVQAVLGLVEPQSSGIGGGAFLLHWNQKDHLVTSWDGRETAPGAATPKLFLKADGTPMSFFEAVVGGRSVGVPGVLRMLEAAHAEHGVLAWKDLFEPAITLARAGFPVSPRLNALLATDDHLKSNPAARHYFYNSDGTPKAVGTILRNPAYAKTLQTIADKGADAFYRGQIASDIVTAVTSDPRNRGLLSLDDMKKYQAISRTPVCAPWKNYTVCGMGPPSSGGIAVAQILKLLEPFDTAILPPTGSQTAHYLAEAGRLAFADRNHYVADSDFVSVPVAGLLDPAYLKTRSGLISPDHAMADAAPGTPPGAQARLDGTTLSQPSTSQISIVDARGNAVSMTTSIENAFGSRLMVDGFLLNNQLTDFSFLPTASDGKTLLANRVEAGKRPRSSMSPTLVFGHDGSLALVVGSPGGSRIIGYVAQTVMAILDQGTGPQTAVSLPHVINRDRPVTEVEIPALKAPLEARGHKVVVEPMTSGLNVILVRHTAASKTTQAPSRQVLIGGSDPRREGVALGY